MFAVHDEKFQDTTESATDIIEPLERGKTAVPLL
jgi:hypothetical protein